MNPQIGILAPAKRPQKWMELYESIGQNDVEFELVFVGPNKPDYELPKNFRFVRSDVKPTQCLEIAFRNTTADLVLNIGDDCLFMTPRPLDRLYETYKTYNNAKLLLSCRSCTNGVDESHFAHRFFTHDPNSPVMPLAALMSKKFFSDLGGLDRNFIAVMWPMDIAMRAYAVGGNVILSDVYLNEESADSVLCSEFWRHDRGLIESLWTKNGKIHFHRAKPVEPFSDVNILNASQGPRGRWRGNGPVFFEKVEDYLVKVNRAIRTPSMYLYHVKKVALRLKGIS